MVISSAAAGGGLLALLLASIGLRLSMLGIALGLPLSVAALHLLMSNIAASYLDIRWLVGGGVVVTAVVVAVASMATWIPARRAAGVDPLIAIRVE